MHLSHESQRVVNDHTAVGAPHGELFDPGDVKRGEGVFKFTMVKLQVVEGFCDLVVQVGGLTTAGFTQFAAVSEDAHVVVG